MTGALDRSTNGLQFGGGQFESASHMLLTQDGDERGAVESLFQVLNADSQRAEGDTVSHSYGTQTQSVFWTDDSQVPSLRKSTEKHEISSSPAYAPGMRFSSKL